MSNHPHPHSAGFPNLKVSVVVPAYNAARTLEETIESVLQQEHTNWELIIVDDCSDDDTQAIACRAAQHDSRIRCLQGAGQGVSAARNLGASQASGEFVAFLDADDLWDRAKLGTHIEHLVSHPQVGVSFDRTLFVSPEGESTGVFSTPGVSSLKPADFLYENPACTASTLVFRRATIQNLQFDESMRFAEDLELLVRVQCCSKWQVEGIPLVLTRYRASPNGASSNLRAMQRGWETLMSKVRTYQPELVEKHYSHARAVHLRYLARRAARLRMDSSVGLELFLKAFRSSPLTLLMSPRRTLGTLAAVLTSTL